jgi:hypothetical protein
MVSGGAGRERMVEVTAPVSVGGLAARVGALPQRVNGDAALLWRGRFLATTILIGIGVDEFLLRIVDGRVVELRRGPFVTPSAALTIIAGAEIWQRLCAPVPAPGDHDLFAFVKRGELQIIGDLHPLMSHVLYFKGLLAYLREGRAAR